MTEAYFEDHPTDPDKVILRKPRLDQGADYERGFVDGMLRQAQSSVDKAVNNMTRWEWVGLTEEEMKQTCYEVCSYDPYTIARAIEAKLKEKNT